MLGGVCLYATLPGASRTPPGVTLEHTHSPPPIIHSPYNLLNAESKQCHGLHGAPGLGPYDANFQNAVCHHLDKLANPDVDTKHGTLEGIKRLGEIWVFCARGFDTLPVALCPGILGKHLAIQLKSLNTQLWELYQHLQIPIAFTNKICLGAATMSWGGLDSDPNWVLGEHDFPTWSPSDLDKYKAPSDWTLEAKRPKSTLLEVWRRNALNQSLVFSLLYGNDAPTGLPHLAPRQKAIERLYQLNLANPNKYTLPFVAQTWDTLNSRWVEELKEQVNKICLLRKVERPTFAELKETGLSPDASGNSIFRFPNTFDLDSPDSFFQHHILGSLERDFGRLRWGQYHRGPMPPSGRNAGVVSSLGPNMTTRERRLCALQSPRATQGAIICWDFNSHHGCTKTPCAYCPNGGKQLFRNYDSLGVPIKIYLLKHGGSKGHKKLDTSEIPKKIQDLRGKFIQEENEKKQQKKDTVQEQIKAPENKTEKRITRKRRWGKPECWFNQELIAARHIQYRLYSFGGETQTSGHGPRPQLGRQDSTGDRAKTRG